MSKNFSRILQVLPLLMQKLSSKKPHHTTTKNKSTKKHTSLKQIYFFKTKKNIMELNHSFVQTNFIAVRPFTFQRCTKASYFVSSTKEKTLRKDKEP